MKIQKPQLIIYDLNETLVSSERVYLETFNTLLSRYDFPKVNKQYMDYIHDMSFEDVFDAWFGRKIRKAIWQEYELYYKTCSYNYLIPIHNSLEFVKYCNSLGIPQVIITNKPSFVALPEIKRLGYYNYINILIGNECGAQKASTEMLDLILTKLNLLDKKTEICNTKNLWIIGNSHQEIEFSVINNAKLLFCGKHTSLQEPINNNVIFIKQFSSIEFFNI